MIEGIPVWLIGLVAGSQGTVGIVMLFWYVDHRRIERVVREKDDRIDAILDEYRKDMGEMRRMYESNVRLVEGYEDACKRIDRTTGDLMDTVRLNTQAYQKLTDFLENRVPCYQRLNHD
jgi:hypothetical protein